MSTSNPTMTREEREAFLAGVHVGVLAVAEPGRGPCAVPIWYSYTPGGVVRAAIGKDTRKARLLREAGRASLVVQDEKPPYKYVSIEGPVEVLETPVAEDQRALAHRYLGAEAGDRYIETVAPTLGDELLLVLRPERWWSADYSGMQL